PHAAPPMTTASKPATMLRAVRPTTRTLAEPFGFAAEEDARVAPGLTGAKRRRRASVEMDQHRVLVARAALRTDWAFGGALLRQMSEAHQREAAALEELRHKREREDTTKSETPSLGDARPHQRAPGALPAGLRDDRERPHLREVGREDRERYAADEPAVVLGHEEVAQVLDQEFARAREHAVLRGVAIDERTHGFDIV